MKQAITSPNAVRVCYAYCHLFHAGKSDRELGLVEEELARIGARHVTDLRGKRLGLLKSLNGAKADYRRVTEERAGVPPGHFVNRERGRVRPLSRTCQP